MKVTHEEFIRLLGNAGIHIDKISRTHVTMGTGVELALLAGKPVLGKPVDKFLPVTPGWDATAYGKIPLNAPATYSVYHPDGRVDNFNCTVEEMCKQLKHAKEYNDHSLYSACKVGLIHTIRKHTNSGLLGAKEFADQHIPIWLNHFWE